MPTAPGLYRLTATVERGDGRAMPKSWRLDPLELRVWGVRGAVVTPAPPIDATAAGQPFAVSISVENAGTTAWTYGESGPRVGDDTASAVTQLEVTWLDGDGKQWPAMAPLLLGSASAQVQQVTLSLTAPKLPGDYSLIFDVADGSGSLLGAEDLAHVLSLGVGPTPIESVDPTQNR
jgi:hypothetical protein